MSQFKTNPIVLLFFTIFLVPLSFLACLELIARVGSSIYTNDNYLTYNLPFEPIREIDIKAELYHAEDGYYFKGIKGISYPEGGSIKDEPLDVNIITYNSKGFRSPEFSEVPQKIRVACFGGSSTWGSGANNHETWPAFLQKNLDNLYQNRFEVINAGMGSFNSKLILTMFEHEFINYKPDIIFIYSGFNDHTGGYATDLQQTPGSKDNLLNSGANIFFANINHLLDSKSVLYKAIKRVLEKGFKKHDVVEVGRFVKERYKTNIVKIIKIAKEKGIRVVLVKQPLFLISDSHIDFGKYFKDPFFNAKTIKQIEKAQAEGLTYAHRYGKTYYAQMSIFNAIHEIKQQYAEVVVLDFVNEFIAEALLPEQSSNASARPWSRKSDLFQDAVHLTIEGNRLLANKIVSAPQVQSVLETLK